MLNKYIFEKPFELFWIVIIFASIALGSILALIFIPFMKGESSIILGIVVFSVILFLPVLSSLVNCYNPCAKTQNA